jgi:hypothetical protein
VLGDPEEVFQGAEGTTKRIAYIRKSIEVVVTALTRNQAGNVEVVQPEPCNYAVCTAPKVRMDTDFE